jgi:hypothetical protein
MASVGNITVGVSDELLRVLDTHAARMEAVADRMEAVLAVFLEAAKADEPAEEPPAFVCACGRNDWVTIFDEDGQPAGAECALCGDAKPTTVVHEI